MYKVSPDVQPRNQPTSACCWLTCLEMLFEWKKKDTSQILSTMDKSPNLFPYYMRDNGIAPGECKETAKALGLRWAGDGEIDAQVLENALKAHGPYWVAGMWMKNFSHVIVVTGVNVITQEIKYINPWQNFDLSESSGNMSWLNARGDIWKNCDGSLMYWL
ncbi:MAG: papain-like cysteine protease family protein [Pyrinomonadaceae bacterium]